MRTLLLLLSLTLAACSQQLVPLNIAHRGGAAEAPEETLEAFQRALDNGADWLELDVHASADSVLVCCHDPAVDRTTNGRGAINALRLAELQALDAGYWFSSDGHSFPFRGQGLRIPTLREVLEAFPDTRFVIEIKQRRPSLVAALIELLRALDASERVIVGAMRAGPLKELRAEAPDLQTGFAGSELPGFLALAARREADYQAPAQALMLPTWLARRPVIEKAQRLGLQVHVWTVNERAEMERLRALGVDGIMTDRPSLLREVLAEDS